MRSWFERAKLRAHEWAADRFSFVQYPHIRPVSGRQAQAVQPPKSPGQLLARLILGLVGLVLVALGGVVLIGGAFSLFVILLGL
ncbi:MAG: hypothetical protein ACK4MG_04220 [Aquabacterium sp.]